VSEDIDPTDFFHSILDAWQHGESRCNALIITCRSKTEDSAVFLFAKSEAIVAQFPIPRSILLEDDPLRDYSDAARRELSANTRPQRRYRVAELKQGMRRVTLTAQVLEIPKPKLVPTRFGTRVYVSNVLIADDTGSIRLSLWGKQVKDVAVDDTVRLENADVIKYLGQPQLRLGRNGTLTILAPTERDESPASVA
jgi:replication factor A1